MKRVTFFVSLMGWLLMGIGFSQNEVQIAFDTEKKIFEITRSSPYAYLWLDIVEFEKINLFKSNENTFFLEVYTPSDDGLVRSKKWIEEAVVVEKVRQLDLLDAISLQIHC